MKEYTYKDYPVKIFGIAHFEEHKNLRRLPDNVLNSIPSLEFLGKRVPGARMAFKTNSKSFTVKIAFETLSVDIGMAIYSCQSAFVYVGERQSAEFVGIVNPDNYDCKCFERTFTKSDKMEDITIFLPRNEIIESVSVLIEDEASIEEPTPYKYKTPVLFYGSSITEGGIACNITNGYNAIISRHLDVDYYNLGFSGNAKGELEMADYINTIDMSIFVYDYDHNAPTVDHLRRTHEPFFKRIREKNPSLPIVMMTRPCANYRSDEIARREVVYTTYKNAIAMGDKNVYFIDGEEFFKNDKDKEYCFIDTIHPNDLGFSKMANVIEPLIKKILDNRE